MTTYLAPDAGYRQSERRMFDYLGCQPTLQRWSD
jgi:hypothetical protein